MSDGRFSSKPMRSGPTGDVVRSAGEFSTEARLSLDATQDFLQSPAVRRELNALRDQPFPDVGQLTCAPLHKHTPVDALDLGRPIASATLAQEYLIGLIFLRVVGWAFLLIGGLFVLGAVISLLVMLASRADVSDRFPVMASVCPGGMGLALCAVGAWFGIFRGRVINEMCWFCPRGMIWRTEGVFDWYTWEQVPDVYCDQHAERPAIGICFGGNVSWISFSNTQASRGLVDYLEKRASAACMSTVLNLIAEGKTIRLGPWRLSRSSFRYRDKQIDWQNVVAVECDGRELLFQERENGKEFVRLDEIPFPSLLAALALAIFAHVRERAA